MSICILFYNSDMFGKKLKELRSERNIRQKDLAEKLGCNQSMITRWERCECEPTESVIRKVALYFDVTADYLLGLEDEFGFRSDKLHESGND